MHRKRSRRGPPGGKQAAEGLVFRERAGVCSVDETGFKGWNAERGRNQGGGGRSYPASVWSGYQDGETCRTLSKDYVKRAVEDNMRTSAYGRELSEKGRRGGPADRTEEGKQ